MECLNRDLFRVNFSISGSDILSPLREDNSDFYEYNHVLVPYCSSDLWIGESESNQEECDCGDLDCFNYTANAENLQFAFRGKIIFQSIFRQLMEKHGMDQADEILLGGSSAGGVGILNNAQWVREEMPPGADLLLVSESSWFINFQGSINQVFEGVRSQVSAMMDSPIFDILSNHTPCADTTRGFPCCISAHCLMTTRNDTTKSLAYFPEHGQRTFIINSIYDVFLLAPSVAGLDDFQSVAGGGGGDTTGLLIDFIRLVGEYGGEMNFTLAQTYKEVGN